MSEQQVSEDAKFGPCPCDPDEEDWELIESGSREKGYAARYECKNCGREHYMA